MANTEIMKSPGLSASLDGAAAGDIAASVFTRFDRGMPPDEVVTELVLPVDTVVSLWRTWARLRGAVLLSAQAGQALREASYSHLPIASGGDAVAAVRRFVERPSKPCPRCKSGFREYCTTCPAREAARAARGRLRGANKKRTARSNPSELPRAVEPAPARDGGVLGDAVADVEAGLIDAPAPHSRPVEERQ
jgi:hypothetical protein